MYRLNSKAFEILRDEVEKCAGNNKVSQVEREIAIKRLQRLRTQKGSPATYDELRDTLRDIYPQFSDKVLKQAGKINQPLGNFGKIAFSIKWAAIFLTTSAGLLWVINLPYPMIRLPIAKLAPVLLLPSFISMDYHYREMINSVEQADQLINNATSFADIERGSEKVKEAQNHLNNLPVWFLGYYPQSYYSIFGFSWHFTLDEFQQARRNVARIDAKVFQEQNALASFNQAEQALDTAKQEYEKTQDKEKAIASIQAAIDTLEQIPTQTLAGKTAQVKLVAQKREFAKIASRSESNYQTGTLIEAAKIFALQAAQLSQNPPHTAEEWQQIEKLWQEAIDKLTDINVKDTDYLQAQTLIATYQTNLGIIKTRSIAEVDSQAALKQANEEIQQLIAYSPSDRQLLKARLQGVINQLRTVQSGTTSYVEAQQLLLLAQNKLNQSN